MKNFFIILFLNLMFFNYSYADKPWGDDHNKKMKASKEEIVAHKKWAKNYHKGISDKKRYVAINEKIIGHKIKIKPKLIDVIGLDDKTSMKSYRGKGEMGIIKGAPEKAYHGDEFWTITADFSKCVRKSGHNDCTHHRGSVRTEQKDKNEWTFFNGTDQTPVNMLTHLHKIDLKLLPYEFNMNDMARKEILNEGLLFTKVGWVYQYNAIPNNKENKITNHLMKKTYEHFYGELIETKNIVEKKI